MLGQHCALLPHSKKVFGLIPVSSMYSGIFPQSRDMQDGLLGYSNLAIGVNGCQPCDELATWPVHRQMSAGFGSRYLNG